LGEGLLAEVTGERDELRQQLDKIRRDLAALQDACFGCGRRENQVDVMFRGAIGLIGVSVCDRCIERLNRKLPDLREVAAKETTP
jgi:hypothetical protein